MGLAPHPPRTFRPQNFVSGSNAQIISLYCNQIMGKCFDVSSDDVIIKIMQTFYNFINYLKIALKFVFLVYFWLLLGFLASIYFRKITKTQNFKTAFKTWQITSLKIYSHSNVNLLIA